MRAFTWSPSLIRWPIPQRVRIARALDKSVAEGNALVEHEAPAPPPALGLRNLLQIFEDAALEVIDLLEALREHVGARLLAADAAGAEHGDLPVGLRVELAPHEILELAEAADPWIDRALEGARLDLEGVARVEQHEAWRVEQRVPPRRGHIGSLEPVGIDPWIAQRHDLLLEPHLHAPERHPGRGGELQLQIVETPAEQGPVAQLRHQGVDGLGTPGHGAVDPFLREKQRAFDPETHAEAMERLPQIAEIGQGHEPVEGGDLVRHEGCLPA